jgi:hypothetical protein
VPADFRNFPIGKNINQLARILWILSGRNIHFRVYFYDFVSTRDLFDSPAGSLPAFD